MYNRNNELVLIILNVKLIIPTVQRRKIVSEATVITTAYNITVVHTYYYLSPLLEILPISTNTTFMKTHIHVHVPKTSSMYSVLHVQHTLNKHISGHSVAIYALSTSVAKWHVQYSNQGMLST